MHNQPQRQDASPQLSFRRVWHTASASPITSIVADSAWDVVATASAGEDVALWRMGGSSKATLPNTHGARFALSPLGSLLATAPPGRPIQVWSMPDGVLLQTCALPQRISAMKQTKQTGGGHSVRMASHLCRLIPWHKWWAHLPLAPRPIRRYPGDEVIPSHHARYRDHRAAGQPTGRLARHRTQRWCAGTRHARDASPSTALSRAAPTWRRRVPHRKRLLSYLAIAQRAYMSSLGARRHQPMGARVAAGRYHECQFSE